MAPAAQTRQTSRKSLSSIFFLLQSYRLVVVGSVQAGKSAIVNRFLGKEFEDRYLPTIENFHRKLYKIRGDHYQLDVLDRSGNDPFPAARKLSYITGDIFVVVGAVDNAASIDQMLEIYAQIYECKMGRTCTAQKINASVSKTSSLGACVASPSNTSISSSAVSSNAGGASSSSILPVVFVLNKTDLPSHKWQVKTVEEVRERVAEILPTSHHPDCFVACSAALNENVLRIFGRLFTIGKLPKYMNPETHRMLRNELSADRVTESSRDSSFSTSGSPVGGTSSNSAERTGSIKRQVLHRMRSRFSKETDDEVIVDVNARRPSLRTDLLMNRAKTAAAGGHSTPALQQNTVTTSDASNKNKLTSRRNSSRFNINSHNSSNKIENSARNCIIS